jgi:hypothetical protein
MAKRIAEPWHSFVQDIDSALDSPVEIRCMGGFVLSVQWDLPRPTGDVDFIDAWPGSGDELIRIAAEGTALARKHRLHVQRVTIAEYPADYESRLIDITPRSFRRLKIRAFEVHDLVLAKLSRNSPRDRWDVKYLFKRGVLEPQLLVQRFESELRPYLLNERREALTLQLWIDELFDKGNE